MKSFQTTGIRMFIYYYYQLNNMKRLICNHCGYEWTTKSTRRNVCCPNCMLKVDTEKNEIKETTEKND